MKSFYYSFLGYCAMLFVGIFTSCSDAVNETGDNLDTSYQKEIGIDEVCENLESSFKVITRGGDNEIVYPENYGGAFIENGKLVALIKGGVTSDVEKEYFNRAKSAIILRSCEYSYNELKLLKDKIGNFFSDEKNYGFIRKIEWSTLAVDEEKNRVLVRMNCTPSNLADFKSVVSSSSLILFEDSKGFPYGCSLEMSPGAKINRLGSASAATIGYRAKNSSGDVGIVTAGHVPHDTSMFMEFGGEVLGLPTKCKLSDNVDGAFIPYDDTFSFTYVTKYGKASILTTLGTGFKAGAAIKFEGAKTAAVESGTINNPSTDAHLMFKEGGETVYVTIKDCISVNVYTQVGDSGGLCYLTTNKPIGILSGGDGSIAYMCKISNINKDFGLTMY